MVNPSEYQQTKSTPMSSSTTDFLFIIGWFSYNTVGIISWGGFHRKWIDWLMMVSIVPIVFIWWDFYRFTGYAISAPLYMISVLTFVEKIWRYTLAQNYTHASNLLALCICGLAIATGIVSMIQYSAVLVLVLMVVEAAWYAMVVLFGWK